MSGTKIPNARLQDVVASLSHVKLKQAVRVLRSTAMAAQALGLDDLASALNEALYESTQQGGFPAPLHSKPEAVSVEACYDALDEVQNIFGHTSLRHMSDLTDDPYFDNRITPNKMLPTE